MTNSKMWMGTRDHGEWVPAAAINADFSSVGVSTKTQYLNGGAFVRRSRGTHKEYELTWNLAPRDEIRKIDDLARGLWGDGLIYFLDPFAMDKNLLPAHWASPMLMAYDDPAIVGKDKPTLINTEANSLGYPVKSAVFNAPLNAAQQVMYIPIPPTHTAWLGVHGPANSVGRMRARGIRLNGTVDALTALPILPVTSTTRVGTSFAGSTFKAVEIVVDRNITYSGAMAQVLRTGATPATGGFVSGQGSSGCDFEDTPRTQAYSAVLDKVGMTATLVEVGTWL